MLERLPHIRVQHDQFNLHIISPAKKRCSGQPKQQPYCNGQKFPPISLERPPSFLRKLFDIHREYDPVVDAVDVW